MAARSLNYDTVRVSTAWIFMRSLRKFFLRYYSWRLHFGTSLVGAMQNFGNHNLGALSCCKVIAEFCLLIFVYLFSINFSLKRYFDFTVQGPKPKRQINKWFNFITSSCSHRILHSRLLFMYNYTSPDSITASMCFLIYCYKILSSNDRHILWHNLDLQRNSGSRVRLYFVLKLPQS